MRCIDMADAARQAKANADLTKTAWAFFSDTTGSARCEPATELTGCANVRCCRTDIPKWSGVRVVVVQPGAP